MHILPLNIQRGLSVSQPEAVCCARWVFISQDSAMRCFVIFLVPVMAAHNFPLLCVCVRALDLFCFWGGIFPPGELVPCALGSCNGLRGHLGK